MKELPVFLTGFQKYKVATLSIYIKGRKTAQNLQRRPRRGPSFSLRHRTTDADFVPDSGNHQKSSNSWKLGSDLGRSEFD